LQYFRTLLGIIGGAGTPSEQVLSVQATSMVPMPLHNYTDLPRKDIELWCDFFKQLSGSDKTEVFRRIWEGLNEEERDAVIQDLKVFITAAHLATDNQITGSRVVDVNDGSADSDSDDDDDDDEEDKGENRTA